MPRLPQSQPCQLCTPPAAAHMLEPSVILTCCLSLSLSTSTSTVSPMAQRSSALNRSDEFLHAVVLTHDQSAVTLLHQEYPACPPAPLNPCPCIISNHTAQLQALADLVANCQASHAP